MTGATTGMSRRQVVLGAGAVGLGLLAGCGRLPWKVETPSSTPRVGILDASGAEGTAFHRELLNGLRELGYVAGQNVVVERRHSDGRADELPALAAELIGLPVDVLVAVGPEARLAAQQQTQTLPVVAAVITHRVTVPLMGQDLTHWSRPGSVNVTGLGSVDFSTPLASKRLELLKELAPDVRRVVLIQDLSEPDRIPAGYADFVQTQARRLDLELLLVSFSDPDELRAALVQVHGRGAEAILVDAEALGTRAQIVALAAEYALPAVYWDTSFVREGGLMSYGPGVDLAAQGRRVAVFVDRILKGARPTDLPIEMPTMRFDLVLNLRTAQALGLTIPQHVLLQATEVLQ
jgi:putative tryptophan/tyrosine transport system substrate-binding protein